MAVSRFFSLALGKYDNFSAVTDGLIGIEDTTPDVSLYSLLFNQSTNTISYFDNAEEGQIITVFNIAAEQLLFSGAQIKTASSSGLWSDGASATFLSHNSSFYELSRSEIAGKKVVTAAALDNTPSVAGADVLVLNSDGTYQITDFDDAHEGQTLQVINLGLTASLINDVTKVVIGGSGAALVMAASQGYTFISYDGIWYLTGGTRTASLL